MIYLGRDHRMFHVYYLYFDHGDKKVNCTKSTKKRHLSGEDVVRTAVLFLTILL